MAESTSSSTTTPRAGILTLSIKDKNSLYAAYMPFLINGGLFIPTNRPYEMGQELFMLLSLMDETEKIPIQAKVVWKTPPGSESYRSSGIGVQFTEADGGVARAKIETYLAGALGSDRQTHTM
ncbi:MAG: PilZ domain-containing protein [Methylovulum miyakonense]|uniref:PilZ domain-containing protein n=1 Tax=Methylovulum miyakonense TaxID=645578 RepID=UPI003BB67100